LTGRLKFFHPGHVFELIGRFQDCRIGLARIPSTDESRPAGLACAIQRLCPGSVAKKNVLGAIGFAAYPSAESIVRPPYGLPSDGMPSDMLRLVRNLRGKSGPIEIPAEKLPMIVHFQNIDAPASIEELNPRDFGIACGPGVRLTHASFEMTSAPVTPMPRNWPKWLSQEKDPWRVRIKILSPDNVRPFSEIWTAAFIGD
jgi:hypothetical protein